MSQTNVLCYLLGQYTLWTKFTYGLFEICAVYLIVNILFLQSVFLMAQLANQLKIIYDWRKRTHKVFKWADAAIWTFVVSFFDCVVCTFSAKEHRAFLVFTKNSIDGILVTYFAMRVFLVKLKFL